MTETQFYRYNSTICSLIEKYKDILYKYIEDYNYTIISFDIYQNYQKIQLRNCLFVYEKLLIKKMVKKISQIRIF